jgi:hypothetical protein
LPSANRKGPFAALAVLLFVYTSFEFHEYFEGGVKILASLALSLAFVGAFAALAFGDALAAWARRLYGDGVTFQRRALVSLALVLGTITSWHAELKRVFYVQMRVAELPPAAATRIVYAIFAGLCLWQLCRPSVRAAPLLWIVLCWGLCLRVLGVVFLSADTVMADMLFVIEGASRAVLSGQNPYALTYSWGDGNVFPLQYFPLYWLPFAPFEALGIDIRWLNLLAQAGLGALFLRLSRDRWSDARVLLLFTCLALLPDLVFSVVYRQVNLYWLEVALFVVAVHQRRWRAAGVLVSILTATQIPAFVILFVYLLYLWRVRGARAAVRQGLAAAALLALTLAPFLSVGPARLKYGLFDYLRVLSERQPWGNTVHGLAIAGLAKAAGLGKLMNVLQGAAVLAVGAIYFLRKDDRFGSLLRATILAYALFLWLSPYVYIYYWFPVVIMAALLFLLQLLEPEEREPAVAAARASLG